MDSRGATNYQRGEKAVAEASNRYVYTIITTKVDVFSYTNSLTSAVTVHYWSLPMLLFLIPGRLKTETSTAFQAHPQPISFQPKSGQLPLFLVQYQPWKRATLFDLVTARL
ncbi:hypothetical protein RRG08_011867 [Elysia crispata]|uniref:Uncharacterized protein n=1 Tax=Elysia crispata TaxID=231223 RepID=A0AAE0ZM45_9GAST|nr:hypothetical protein RRG08_011867 [Elysia crispata]